METTSNINSETIVSSSSGESFSSLSPENNNNKLMTLHVKSFQNITITINNDATISQLKSTIIQQLGDQAENRYLRLICKGRLLAPDSAILRDFTCISTNDTLHAVFAAPGVSGGQQAALQRGGVSSRRFRGTGVGPMGRIVRPGGGRGDSDSEHSDEEDDEEQGRRERLGFDRLRAVRINSTVCE